MKFYLYFLNKMCVLNILVSAVEEANRRKLFHLLRPLVNTTAPSLLT